MRFAVLAAALTAGACAAAAPPPPSFPAPSAEGEAALVIQALETGCRDMGPPDAVLRRAQSEGWLRIAPEAGYAACAVEADGPPARIAAIDRALLDYARRLDFTWNVRDSNGARRDGRREVRRTRGEHGQGEPEMTWRFVEVEATRGDVTTLRVEWAKPAS